MSICRSLQCLCSFFLFVVLMIGVHAVGNYFIDANRTNNNTSHHSNDTDIKAIGDSIEKISLWDFLPKKFNKSVDLHAEDKYRYMIETNEVSDERNPLSLMNGCVAEHMTYGCCYKIPEVEFLICVNITYLPHDYGLNFTVRIGDAVYSEEISLRNPPPMCLDSDVLLPYKIGKLCVRIHDIDVNNVHVHFCARLIVEILIKSIYTKELGCVDIPIQEISKP